MASVADYYEGTIEQQFAQVVYAVLVDNRRHWLVMRKHRHDHNHG